MCVREGRGCYIESEHDTHHLNFFSFIFYLLILGFRLESAAYMAFIGHTHMLAEFHTHHLVVVGVY